VAAALAGGVHAGVEGVARRGRERVVQDHVLVGKLHRGAGQHRQHARQELLASRGHDCRLGRRCREGALHGAEVDHRLDCLGRTQRLAAGAQRQRPGQVHRPGQRRAGCQQQPQPPACPDLSSRHPSSPAATCAAPGDHTQRRGAHDRAITMAAPAGFRRPQSIHSEDAMFDPERLLKQMVGGALGNALGGRSRSRGSSGGGIAGALGGGKAQLGLGLLGVAFAAYEHYSSQQRGATPAASPMPAAAMPPPPPTTRATATAWAGGRQRRPGGALRAHPLPADPRRQAPGGRPAGALDDRRRGRRRPDSATVASRSAPRPRRRPAAQSCTPEPLNPATAGAPVSPSGSSYAGRSMPAPTRAGAGQPATAGAPGSPSGCDGARNCARRAAMVPVAPPAQRRRDRLPDLRPRHAVRRDRTRPGRERGRRSRRDDVQGLAGADGDRVRRRQPQRPGRQLLRQAAGRRQARAHRREPVHHDVLERRAAARPRSRSPRPTRAPSSRCR
jgi:hypothetical protein